MPLKIMKKEFFIKQIENIVKTNSAFNRVSWVVIFENNNPVLYALNGLTYKSKKIDDKEWASEDDLHKLPWHILVKMPLKIKSSQEKSLQNDLDWYKLMPEFNIDKVVSSIGSAFVKMVNNKP